MLENKSAINRATRVPVSAARKTMLDAEGCGVVATLRIN